MKTPLSFNGPATSSVSNSGNRFAPLAGNGTNVTSLSAGVIVSAAAGRSPIAGTIRRLNVRFPTPLTQGTYEIKLLKGATPATMVETALGAIVAVGDQNPVNLVSQVSVAAGDYLGWLIRPSGTPTAQSGAIQIACIFDADVEGESLIWGFAHSASTFMGLGIGSFNNTTEANSVTVFPTDGTISDLTINLPTAAPGAGNSRTYTLRKGTAYGALSDTAAAVTISGTATSGSDSDAISFAAGDLAVIALSTTGTPASSNAIITAKWVPSVPGEALVFATAAPSLSTTAARFVPISGMTLGSEATGANVQAPAPADLTVKRIRAAMVTAPGAGKSRTATLRREAADTALTVTIADSDTTGAAATDVVVTSGERINFATVPTASPAGAGAMTFSAVMVVSASADAPVFLPTNISGETFEGVRNTVSKVVAKGIYGGVPTNVEVALFDAPTGGTLVKDWASAAVQSGGLYRHTFTDVPVGGPYYHRVRDNGGAATASTAELYVGAIAVLWGQSQRARLASQDTGSPSVSATNVRVAITSNITNVSTANRSITKLTAGMSGIANVTGSGVVALANQWHADVGADVPLLIVMCAYSGTAIQSWIDDLKGDTPTNADVTTLWGTSPTTGLATHMADLTAYQASAVVWSQGTSNIGNPPAYAAQMDGLKAKFDALYNGTDLPPLMIVDPHARSDDGNNTFAMRQVQFTKASSGGNWRVGSWSLDHQLESDSNPHQINGPTGNGRLGRRVGRGIAKNLIDAALDIAGPRISRAEFTDETRTVIEITYDRDISLADGTVYAGAPVTIPAQHNVSADSGATFTTLAAPGFVTTLVAARKVRLTKTSGSWPTGTTRVDILRGTPWSSTSAYADFVGPEADMEANFLSKVITDTSSFDSGRGMPHAPYLGTGFAVTEAGAGVVYGPFTLTVTGGSGATASLPPFTITVTG